MEILAINQVFQDFKSSKFPAIIIFLSGIYILTRSRFYRDVIFTLLFSQQ